MSIAGHDRWFQAAIALYLLVSPKPPDLPDNMPIKVRKVHLSLCLNLREEQGLAGVLLCKLLYPRAGPIGIFLALKKAGDQQIVDGQRTAPTDLPKQLRRLG